jgi:myosin-5
MILRSSRISAGCKHTRFNSSVEGYSLTFSRLSPNQIQKLLNQYLVADYEQPINGEIMKAVASRVTEKSDVLLLQAVDMDDSGPYEIAEPRSITALETYTPSCKPPSSSLSF